MCIFKRYRILRIIGTRLTLSANFSIRDQINLVNYLAAPNKLHENLLNYRDYAIKFTQSYPLAFKHSTAIMHSLLSRIISVGPLDVL